MQSVNSVNETAALTNFNFMALSFYYSIFILFNLSQTLKKAVFLAYI